mmetsp:Transcript_56743/g.166065  ORF Transcript_56743/g.166065 Transcript_56743/m.166065 type:complete len:235 (+) Transcript_56743:183-887(+)
MSRKYFWSEFIRIRASLSSCSLSCSSAEAILLSLYLSCDAASCCICSSLRLFSSSPMRLGAPLLAMAASLRWASVSAYSSRLLTMWPLGPRLSAPGRPAAGDRLLPGPRLASQPAASLRDSLLLLLLELEDPLAAFFAAFLAFLAAFFAFLAAFFSFFRSFLACFSAFFSRRALISGLAIIDSRAACSCLLIWKRGSSRSFLSMSSEVLVALRRKREPAVLSPSFFMSSRSLSF